MTNMHERISRLLRTILIMCIGGGVVSVWSRDRGFEYANEAALYLGVAALIVAVVIFIRRLARGLAEKLQEVDQ